MNTVRPEVVAVIMAAVQQMLGTDKLVITIKQPSLAWPMAGRIKNMNQH